MYPASHDLAVTLAADRRHEAERKRSEKTAQLADRAPRWWRLRTLTPPRVTSRPAMLQKSA